MNEYLNFPNAFQQGLPTANAPYSAPQLQTPMYQMPRSYQYPQQNYQVQPQAYQPQTQPQQQNSPMVWVQGEAGAKAYVLPNGTTLPLWDSEAQVIYIKSVDGNGRPSMTILDYTDRNAPAETEASSVEYVTKEQMDQLNGQFAEINEKLNSMSKYVTRDQFDTLNNHLNDLGNQIESIENRITSFGKPQQNNNRRTK